MSKCSLTVDFKREACFTIDQNVKVTTSEFKNYHFPAKLRIFLNSNFKQLFAYQMRNSIIKLTFGLLGNCYIDEFHLNFCCSYSS
jgi:hypothetical protein